MVVLYSKPIFAVRADHAQRKYWVYEVATNKNIKEYRYKTESDRAKVAGKASLQRNAWNDNMRRFGRKEQ